MPVKIVLSGPAEADLASIEHYLSINAGPRIAGSVLARIFDKFELLTEHPRLGVDRSDLVDGCRVLFSQRYVIIYDFDHERSQVDILRIAHGSRELHALFDQN